MKFFVFVLTFMLLSCQNRDNFMKISKWDSPTFEYYENGKIKSIFETENGLKNGKLVEYYPNGIIKSQSNWINDTITGVANQYYESGIIKSITSWHKGVLWGYNVEYDETGSLISTCYYQRNKKFSFEVRYEKGIMCQLSDYVIIADSSQINRIIYYDDFGNIIADSSRFFSMYFPTIYETIPLNELSTIGLSLPYAAQTKRNFQMRIVIGEFDNFFNILDPLSLDTILVNDIYHELTFSFDKPGIQHLNCIILHSFNDKKGNLKEEKMYFSKPFIVQEVQENELI